MHDNQRTIRLMLLAFMTSLLTHVLAMYAVGWFGNYDFAFPVMPPAVMVDLRSPSSAAPEPDGEQEGKELPSAKDPDANVDRVHAGEPEENVQRNEASELTATQPDIHKPSENSQAAGAPASTPPLVVKHENTEITNVVIHRAPVRTATEFLGVEQETLTYRISLLGLPVGSGELAATQEKTGMKISLRVASSMVIAALYPVDDLIETRLLNGDFIITTIKQLEGSFKGDRGFTLFLREKSAFWRDNLKNLSTREPLPTSDVLDILSGLYYLRNRPLQVGVTETLHIFDSNIYTLVPVEVVRREKTMLPGFRRVDTLLLHPLIKTEGIFKRAGDILIWVTDDANHVPVRVETAIRLGKVTAELTDSVVKRTGDPVIPGDQVKP